MIRAGDLPPEDVAASAAVIAEQTRRMASIIRQLLDFSRRTGPSLADADVDEVASSTLDMLAPLAEKRGVALRFRGAGAPAGVRADRNQLQQAIANLVVNAVQATPGGGAVTLGVGRRHASPPQDVDAAAGEFVEISVADAGSGIAAEHLPHVFEPFFTTKDVGEGTGLGLAVAYGIVREHGGWIEVESEPGQGSRFSILLPPVASAEQARRRAVA
jgi:signal transduction histidine kinase